MKTRLLRMCSGQCVLNMVRFDIKLSPLHFFPQFSKPLQQNSELKSKKIKKGAVNMWKNKEIEIVKTPSLPN